MAARDAKWAALRTYLREQNEFWLSLYDAHTPGTPEREAYLRAACACLEALREMARLSRKGRR